MRVRVSEPLLLLFQLQTPYPIYGFADLAPLKKGLIIHLGGQPRHKFAFPFEITDPGLVETLA
ncbi:MAG: Uncharacterised protein [Rhodothermaeota bacterium MED-G12]|nr:MAG: Uncharacterised protein [Rhodothermaeota bacterium MED-G12]